VLQGHAFYVECWRWCFGKVLRPFRSCRHIPCHVYSISDTHESADQWRDTDEAKKKIVDVALAKVHYLQHYGPLLTHGCIVA
jgi:hypothetical protein